jgi:pimeloyl-ACP methyl ester carboxylesterase
MLTKGIYLPMQNRRFSMNANGSLREVYIEGHTMTALAFNTELDNIPVIFIHGIVASIYGWPLEQIPLFDAHPWYSISLPGHAPAVFPEGFGPQELSAERIAAIVHQTITALIGDRPFILVGHSTGGFVALAVAAFRPKNVQAVCSISGFVQGNWHSVLGYLQWLARQGGVGRILFYGHLNLFKLGQRLARRKGEALRPELKAWSEQNDACFQHLDPQSIHAWFLHMPAVDISAQLANIRVPTLVIYGEKDPIVLPEQAYSVAAAVLYCDIVEFPGVGHLPTTERPDLYAQTMNGWMKKVSPWYNGG